ncbi:MAG TPA: DUF5671 domain-containing protein [Gammaproteobacteria bacterium]|jgi:hypothetical protein
MADARLTAFIDRALATGASKAEIQKALEEAGWSRDQISDGLGHYADVSFAVPVPRPKAQLSARDAFLYLLMFGMLYVSAYHLGGLLFQFINLAFPDESLSDVRGYYYSRIRSAVAALIVAFPILLLLASRLAKEIVRDPTRRTSSVRRWLTYLTLLVAACVLTGDLISLIYSLLSGELTVRFLLKVLVIAAIAGAVFGYYLWSLKADEEALGG